MASTSSSSIITSPAADVSSYDVFLSFRGEDTRNAFTDHLYQALVRAGLGTFRDDDEICRGHELKPEIERAIKESRASIVVLSENYATSTWCLDELLLILDQRRECNRFVLPIFYHVDPTDVRKQDKTFTIEVKTSSRWTDHNVKRWKAALTEVVDLAGMVLEGSETKFLEQIVDIIYNELDRKEVHIPPNLVGIHTRDKEINSWLKQSNAEFLAICGMGGSGKTTLARYIVYSNWQNFENISIVEDIGSRCKEPHDLLQLQEKLLGDIVGGKKRKIPSVCQGTFKIEEALQTKKALIVLDDIAEPSQLLALLGNGNINKESKIIITTRVNNTGEWFESRSWRCHEYKMKLLDDDESLKLLRLHAFRSKIPMEGFEELAIHAVKYCEGNPLALEVLGSSLSKSNTISCWKSQLNLLEKDIDSRIQGVLIRSYESLPYDYEKELFLHIACFFIRADMDYVVKILEHDYSALSGIKTLINRCLLFVSPNKKLMMHHLLQEMGRNIVRQESLKHPEKRSRVWLSSDSYKILSKGKGSETMEGLALDMQMLRKEKFAFKSSDLKTDALKKMDNLKLLQLNFVHLTGSYENFSEDLRWLCWLGFNLGTIPSDLYMGNLVAIDMSYSNLVVFEPPMVLQSLQILNLKDSHDLYEIRNISRIPHLETLILWNCDTLVCLCKTIGDLTSLALLNMTGCKSLCKSEQINVLVGLNASTSGGEATKQPPFSFPNSLQRLFLKDCNLDCTNSFPLSFNFQPFLQYLNLGNSSFELLPCYDHLKDLRVLDLSFCSRLKQLQCLPCTLAELYIYYCKSLEKITFQSHRFTLQEFGYEGCINLFEVEDFIKLVPIAKLHETDLGHMKWLKEYQSLEMCLVGDDELTIGRSWHAQMLYEFNIMSISLPDIKDPNVTPEFTSKSSFLSFEVPLSPKDRRLKGLNVTFKYTISSEDWAWFAKISTIHGVDLMYNPKVFGKPGFTEVGMWLSYWPIGNKLDVGDKVNVSIAVISGLEVHECGASLVYTDDDIAEETLENNMGWLEILEGDLSGFKLSTGAYYLCRRDFFELMEVGRLTPGWFRILVGDTIDYTEVRGWRKTGRPKQSNPPFTELKTVRCIIHGPESEEIYKIAEMSKSSLVDKNVEFTSGILGETVKSGTTFESSDAATKASSPLQLKYPDGDLEQLGWKLFITMLPKNVSEGEVSALFSQFGTLKDIQILGGSGQPIKGCAFVTYETKEQAVAAIEGLNGKYKMMASGPLRIKFADGELERLEHKLFIGMLPKNVSEGEVSALFSQYGTLNALQILRGSQQTSKGCAFVKYDTKEQAVAAIEGLNGKHKMEGSTVPLVVKWADTEKERQARKAQKAQLTQHPSLFGALPLGYMSPFYGYWYQNHPPFANPTPNQENALQVGSPRDYAVPRARYMGPAFPVVPRGEYPPGDLWGMRSFSRPSSPAPVPRARYIEPSIPLVPRGEYPPRDLWGMRPFSSPSSPASPEVAENRAATSSPVSGRATNHVEGPPGANLFIYHIPQEFGDRELAGVFQAFGRVLSSKVFVDTATGVSKCFGFVSYDSPAAAQFAINMMNGYELGGKKLKVQLKREPPKKSY